MEYQQVATQVTKVSIPTPTQDPILPLSPQSL